MTILSDHQEKRNLLELLAYLLCEHNIACELGYGYIGFGLDLYRKILKDLECQQQNDQPISSGQSSFTAISGESRKLAELIYAKKTLEMIEARASTVKDYLALTNELEGYLDEEKHLSCKY
jgi:hypothetical protein